MLHKLFRHFSLEPREIRCIRKRRSAAIVGLGLIVLNGRIGRVDGLLLLLGPALYFCVLLRSTRTERKETEVKLDTFDRERKRVPAGEPANQRTADYSWWAWPVSRSERTCS